jgi:tetratricopeptide (TPR) repeat protein
MKWHSLATHTPSAVSLLLLASCAGCIEAPRAEHADSAVPTATTTKTIEPVEALKPLTVKTRDRPVPCVKNKGTALDAALEMMAQNEGEAAYSCASEAIAEDPNDAVPYAVRSEVSMKRGRLQAAATDVAFALALEPDSTDALLAAARLYSVYWPKDDDQSALALLYAQRGAEAARLQSDNEQSDAFHQLLPRLLNAVGKSQEALDLIAQLETKGQIDDGVAFERAVALFELCRFSEARPAFERLLASAKHLPYARYYLGLLFERAGDDTEASRQFFLAHAANADAFSVPLTLSKSDFEAAVQRAVTRLAPEPKATLEQVTLVTDDVPPVALLQAEDPPLSPTALGLMVGPPLSQRCPSLANKTQACRTIYLFRNNHLRAVSRLEDLESEIETTLLHELGHVHGDDDAALSAKGLE